MFELLIDHTKKLESMFDGQEVYTGEFSHYGLKEKRFQEFLKGTHASNTSSHVRFLPHDVLHIIYEKYLMDTLLVKEMITFKYNKLYLKHIPFKYKHFELMYQSSNFDLMKNVLLREHKQKKQSTLYIKSVYLGRLVKFCCDMNDVEMLDCLYENYKERMLECNYYNGILFVAAKKNFHPVLLWWHEKNIKPNIFNKIALEGAIEGKQVDLFKWMIGNRPEYKPSYRFKLYHFLPDAVYANCKEIVDIIIPTVDADATPYLERAVEKAVAIGNFEMLHFLTSHPQTPFQEHKMFIQAATNHGQLEMLKYLFCCAPSTNKPKRGQQKKSFIKLLKVFHVETIQWLIENHLDAIDKTQLQPSTMFALEEGQLEIVKLLYQIYPEFYKTFHDKDHDYAVESQNIELLTWLKEVVKINFCSDKAIEIAATKGNLKLIQWLVENYPFCGYNHRAIEQAVLMGHTDVAIWLYEYRRQDWMFTNQAFELAVLTSNLKLVQFFHKIYKNSIGSTYVSQNFSRVDYDVLEWVLENVKSYRGSMLLERDVAIFMKSHDDDEKTVDKYLNLFLRKRPDLFSHYSNSSLLSMFVIIAEASNINNLKWFYKNIILGFASTRNMADFPTAALRQIGIESDGSETLDNFMDMFELIIEACQKK